MDPKSYIKFLKTHWALLAQGGSMIFIAVKGFVIPSDAYDPVSNTSQAKNFALFIVAVLCGIFFYLGRTWSQKKAAKGWAIATVLFLIALIAADQIFKEFKATCTCHYSDQTILIGNKYSPLGEQDAAKHRGVRPCEDILMDFGSRMNLIWTQDSINTCRRYLTLTYLFTFSMAALCLLSVVQTISCYKSKRRPAV
jgi:hypothetical protein